MMKAREIKEWLDTLNPDADVSIDDGGLALIVVGQEGAYCEVGGVPEPERDVEPGDHVMPVDEFLRDVDDGSIMDDDGYGVMATVARKSSITVYPSDAAETIAKHRATWTHVVWYNR